MNKQTALSVALIALILALFAGYGVSHAEDEDTATVTFYVHCYDVGKSALKNLDGVKDVERGFLGSREINTVHYDPAVITVEEMVKALEDANTYSGTVEEE